MITIDKTFNGKKITAKKGDVLKVQLAENSTSGYLWKINSLDEKHLHHKEEEHKISSQVPGASGIRTFTIEVVKEGISELHLKLGNPWENDTVDTFNLTIETQP